MPIPVGIHGGTDIEAYGTGGEMKVEYDSNNSGGSWWLSDEDWYALERAGWKVRWFKDRSNDSLAKGERFLGALADSATREGLPLDMAVSEWEQITGKSSTDAGCPCCGQPHSFTEVDDEGRYVDSGPHADYSCSW